MTGADGVERLDVRSASRKIETPVGDVEVKRQLYQASAVEGLAPMDAALGLPDEKYTHHLRRIHCQRLGLVGTMPRNDFGERLLCQRQLLCGWTQPASN